VWPRCYSYRPGCKYGGRIIEIDLGDDLVCRRFDSCDRPAAFALGEGSVWFGTLTTIYRIDPSTGEVVGQMKLAGPSFGATAAFGYLWITDTDDELLFKIKPA
jgi:hypothetical protein